MQYTVSTVIDLEGLRKDRECRCSGNAQVGVVALYRGLFKTREMSTI